MVVRCARQKMLVGWSIVTSINLLFFLKINGDARECVVFPSLNTCRSLYWVFNGPSNRKSESSFSYICCENVPTQNPSVYAKKNVGAVVKVVLKQQRCGSCVTQRERVRACFYLQVNLKRV